MECLAPVLNFIRFWWLIPLFVRKYAVYTRAQQDLLHISPAVVFRAQRPSDHAIGFRCQNIIVSGTIKEVAAFLHDVEMDFFSVGHRRL